MFVEISKTDDGFSDNQGHIICIIQIYKFPTRLNPRALAKRTSKNNKKWTDVTMCYLYRYSDK